MRKLIRKLLVLILAAWLPVYTGAAVASIVCQDAGKIGHAHGAEQGTHSTGGAAGVADDCGGCDFCYSHCTLSLPATGYPVAAQGPGAIPQAAAAPLISLSLPPADRPPLSRLG